VLADNLTIAVREPVHADDLGDSFSTVRRLWLRGADGRPHRWDRPEPATPPRISVLVATHNRAELLQDCLMSFAEQTVDRSAFEVVVVDDGSDPDEAARFESALDGFADKLQIVGVHIPHSGRSAAKNLAVLLARAPLVLFFDDDDRASPNYLERHLAGHDAKPAENVAILGHTDWAPELSRTELMHFVTDVDRLMFAYERFGDGQELDWRGFWEGRISCKRALLTRYALHDQRLVYSIDVELGWRLAPNGLRVVYDAKARSVMARPIGLDDFCARTEAKGRAHAVVAALHTGTDAARRLVPPDSVELWERKRAGLDALRQRVRTLEHEADTDRSALAELHHAYRELFKVLHAKGVAEATGTTRPTSPTAGTGGPATTVGRFTTTEPAFEHDGTPATAPETPVLSISIPVWSTSNELAEMARRTIERIWDVARVPTEVIAVDNGSPHQVPLAAKVHRYPENRGVSVGWNTGIRLSTAAVVAVLNSDCRVEPGWDEALYEAATDGRRIAFPYTDHCDGRGFTCPDQAGTAGWCFMMSRAVYDEIGPFDEWFSPAFGEDTDYWHRAWQLGIELSPVPAARVVHARRTTGGTHARTEWLLQGHRYKYGWKHGVDPLRAPPYYKRDIVEYHGTISPPAGESAGT
jgi:glycosyltransferase involved in cell wall biosynthesis